MINIRRNTWNDKRDSQILLEAINAKKCELNKGDQSFEISEMCV